MATVQVQDLIEAGVHFGHRASRWNPKMRPYIFGKRNLIHIIDLRETVRGLLRACRFLSQRFPGEPGVCSSAPNGRRRKRSKKKPPAAACRTSANAGSAAPSPTTAPSAIA